MIRPVTQQTQNAAAPSSIQTLAHPTAVASLPMYDWPEIRDATDAIWAALRTHLASAGLQAPASLTRSDNPEPIWTDPNLVLSQTCGRPYACSLSGKVCLVGTPVHAITGAAPGHYFSACIARRSSPPQSLADLRDQRFAFNMTNSQSGFAAPARLLAENRISSRPPPLETGSHRASIRAVANGDADWAAIDAVSWELAQRHEPATDELMVFARTAQTPALPLISAMKFCDKTPQIANAYEAMLETLDKDILRATMISGLVRFTPVAYVPLAAPIPTATVFPGLRF